jgi:hypothetical protein
MGSVCVGKTQQLAMLSSALRMTVEIAIYTCTAVVQLLGWVFLEVLALYLRKNSAVAAKHKHLEEVGAQEQHWMRGVSP